MNTGRSFVVVIATGMVLALSGCVSNQPRGNAYGYNNGNDGWGGGAMRGTVDRIEQVQGQGGGDSSGIGAVGGAVAGGLVGNQIGKGKGKTLATIAGVAAGAYAGNEVEKAYSAPKPAYRFSVRLADGRVVSVTQPEHFNMRIGDRVRIDQNRVVPDF